MGTYDLTLGCLLFSSWANMILFILEYVTFNRSSQNNSSNRSLQTDAYFMRYPKDGWFNKASVLVAVSSDFTTVFACLSANYLYLVTHWGTQPYLLTQPWCVAVYVVSTSISSGAVQLWLARMVVNLTKQWVWIPVISIFILAGLTGAGATAGLLVIDSSYAARGGLIKWVTLWLSGCVAADTVITAVLLIKFRTIKTSFSDTKSLIRRLSVAAVRNGSITTIMTLDILYYRFKFQMTIGRVYTLSMLSNLNKRSALLGESQGSNTKRTTADPSATILRIRQDVETHYKSDTDAIQMTDYDVHKLNSTDGSSDIGKPYDNGF
ncbi:hypothetical protein C8R44DRAFT_868943 [Mycena epipterygia]|nr:hypothetical protein C8R44DRAFT_868943 [Mycena epipterygia]